MFLIVTYLFFYYFLFEFEGANCFNQLPLILIVADHLSYVKRRSTP